MASPEALELLREALRILPSATARALAKSQRDRSHRAQASASDWKPALDYQRLAVRLLSFAGAPPSELAASYSVLGELLSRQHFLGNGDADDARAALKHAVALAPSQPAGHRALVSHAFDVVVSRAFDDELSPERAHAALLSVLRRGARLQRLAPALCRLDDGDDGGDLAALQTAATALRRTGVVGAWAADDGRLQRARRTLRAGRPHSIPAALSPDLARRALSELRALPWNCDDGLTTTGRAPSGRRDRGAFLMRRCMPAVAEGAIASRGGGSALAAAMTLLKGAEMRTLVGLLAGRRLDGVTMTQPTRFRVGDGLSLHNDAQDSRVVAFAWHLGWEPGDGGELAFLCPEDEEGGHLVRPRLNTLTLFRTDATTGAARGFLGAHAVLPVLRNGTDRYALSGWFTLGDQKSG